MNNNEQLLMKNKIFDELLKTKSAAKTSNDNQIKIRCKFCGDSRNQDHSHMYVGVMNTQQFMIGYHCKKCQSSGVVSKDFLEMYDIKNVELNVFLKKNRISTIIKKNINSNTLVNNYNIPDEILQEDKFKIDYLSSRFNRKITKDDLKQYKIVLNLNQFLKFNNINLYRDTNTNKMELKTLVEEYTKTCVGFLSFDNNIIQFRNINSNVIRYKYSNLQINKDFKNPLLYVVKKNIDLISRKPKIIIAEGIFDIIGVKERFCLDDDVDSVLCSPCGKSFKVALNQIIKMTGFVDSDVFLYVDKDTNRDIDKGFFNNHMSQFIPNFNITIVYNDKGKDFGEMSEEIDIKTYKL